MTSCTETSDSSQNRQAAEPLWTINDVAAYCARSRRTVERWLAARQLPHHRLPSGRPVFRPSRIRELIESTERW